MKARLSLLALTLALGAVLASACARATPTPAPTPTPTAIPLRTLTPGERELARRFNEAGWGTDLTRVTVPLEEVRPIIPRDAIPAILEPKFDPVQEADKWLEAGEEVLALEVNGDARAYPIAILIRHEIVNDTVGGEPVAVTY